MVEAKVARVRPRVGRDAMLLEDAVEAHLADGRGGHVRLLGRGAGAGRTTALRHLAAVMPDEVPVRVLDNPSPDDLEQDSVLIVYAKSDIGPRKCDCRLVLSAWTRDEVIEYLLAGSGDRCASVMRRLGEPSDTAWLAGNPELWCAVLEEMVADERIESAVHALRSALTRAFATADHRSLASFYSLYRLCESLETADETRRRLAHDGCAEAALRLLRHKPVQVQLAAEKITRDLAEGRPCRPLRHVLPREVIREIADLIAGNERVQHRLRGEFSAAIRTSAQPMAASILHCLDKTWRPDVPRLERPGKETVTLSLCNAYLERASWPGIDLSRFDVTLADLRRADLSGADLERVHADEANLTGAILRGARLRAATLDDARLDRADLSGVDGDRASFDRVRLTSANLAHAKLDAATFRSADLTGARFTNARLARVDFEDATIAGADFTGADLSGAGLSRLPLYQATWTDARFVEALLTDCDFEAVKLTGADFNRANLFRAYLTGSRMPGANFRSANLCSAGLADVDWEGVDLRYAKLAGASFHLGSSRSGRVDSFVASEGTRTGFYTDDSSEQGFKAPEEIRKANLRGADLRGADVARVDFYLVDLRDAVYDDAQREHFRRCRAIL